MTMLSLAISFLAPAAGIIAGAIALPLFLAIYFLKLRRRPARISSTLLWEVAAKDLQANVPFRMIRPSWLLLLQLLILALFVAALARPALNLPGIASQRTIIVIDRTASMNARDAAISNPPASRLDHAKQLARDAATQITRSGGQAMLVTFAARPQVLTQFTANRSLLLQTIDAIEPTDQPADFDRAIALLTALTRGGADEQTDTEPPPQILLISDGQLRRRSTTGPTLAADHLSFRRVGPAAESLKDNFGIVALAARRDFEDPGLIRVFVRVQSTAATEQTITLHASFAGQHIATATLTLPAPVTDPITNTTTLSEAGHSFELRTQEPGLLLIRHARPDALASDDAAAVMLTAPVKPRLAIIHRDASRTISDFALLEALSVVDPDRLDQFTAAEYERRARDASFYGSYDLLIFNRVEPVNLPPLPTLSINAALPVPGLQLVEPDQRSASDFTYWDRAHPVLRGVGLGIIQLDSPASLITPTNEAEPEANTASTTSTSPAAALTTTILASTRAGTAIALLERASVRRLLIAPDLDATTWWSDQSFPIFLVNAIEHLTLTGGHAAGQSFTTASETRLLLPPTTAPIQLTQPDQSSLTSVPPNQAGLTSLGVLPLAGVWTATVANQQYPIAVNLLDADESSLQTSDTLIIAGTTIHADTKPGTALREIWHWLIVAALVLLALEWFVFALRSRL